MKILIATPVYPPEIASIASYTKRIAENLCCNNNITIVAYSNNPEKIPGVRLVSVNKNSPLLIRLLKYTITLWKESSKSNVVYAQNAVVAGLPAIIVGKLRKIPVVIRFLSDEAWERASQAKATSKNLDDFLSNIDGGIKIKFLYFLQKVVLNNAHTIVVPSKYMGEIIIRSYKVQNKKITVNYTPYKKPESIPFSSSPIPYQISTSGKLVPWEKTEEIIKAIQLLKKDFPEIRLLIMGDGPEEKYLKSLVKKLGITKNIKFLGHASQPEKIYVIKNSSLFIQNSISEYTPDVLFHSLTLNIPVIALNTKPLNEIIVNEKSGLLVKSGNAKELASAIKRIFKNPNLSKNITTEAKIVSEKKFSLDAHITSLNNIFSQIKN